MNHSFVPDSQDDLGLSFTTSGTAKLVLKQLELDERFVTMYFDMIIYIY